MQKEKIIEELFESIVELDMDKGKKAAEILIEEQLDPLEGIEKGLSMGMREIGERFGRMEIFLPDLVMAADVFNAAIELLRPQLSKQAMAEQRKGTVVIGTVKGDIHRIGKDIVALLLETAGFEVYNLGEDVGVSKFIEEAEGNNADIIALSSLLTTTMPVQKDLLDVLKETGMREKFSVVIGGAPTSQKWAESIGADGYGKDADRAVELSRELVSTKGR